MDELCELTFLNTIESKKGILTSTQMAKYARGTKEKAWQEGKDVLLVEKGTDFSETQMLKKWNNI